MRANAATAKGSQPALGMHSGEWLLLGVLGLIWGSGFLFAKIVVRDIPPLTMVLIRTAMAATILLVVLRARGIPLPPLTQAGWRPYLVLGLTNVALPFTLNGWGLTRIDSGLAGILTATVPVFTVVIAHLVTDDERATTPMVLGVAVGLTGVIAIVGPNTSVLTSGSGLGKLAVMTSCVCYGVAAVYARSLRGTAPLVIAACQLLMAAVVLLPVALIVDRPWSSVTWSRDAVLSMVILTLFGTVAGYLLFFRILAGAGAVSASLVAYLIPVVAVILGTVFLDERLALSQVLGMVLIFASLGVIDGRLARWLSGLRAVRPVET
jgi:drug/metabolite transporter (DMT)-like permease